FAGTAAGEPLAVSAHTDYPGTGRITLTVEEAPADAREWTLSLRIPQWCERYAVSAGGEELAGERGENGWLRLRRAWRTGDTVVLDLDLTPRLTVADPRVDSVRGCVAIE